MDKKPTILVVDDKQTNIKILVEYLSDDYDVIVCLCGEEALHILEREKINLILLDIIMPVMDGFEVCKKINATHEKFEIPIIFVTSSHSEVDIQKGFDLGAVDYITKPFKKVEILSRIKTHIQLQDYKHNLEQKVKDEIEKNRIKEKIMFHQSKLISAGEMINSIAHQWRQPLASINSAVIGIDSLLMKENITSNDRINSKLEDIEKQTCYMSKTIEDFSNYLNPNKEKNRYFFKDIVEESSNILKSKLSKNFIELKIDIKDNKLVTCYKGEITQVLIVLINNAIDALKQNNIQNPKIIITVDENKLFIEDNAGGIKQKNIDDIFIPYFSTKKEQNGLGIGLYVAKMIIEDSNSGMLTASNKKQGACFCIVLPKNHSI